MQSRKALFYAFNFLFKALEKLAAGETFKFLREKGADDVISHYQRVRTDLLSLGSSLKAAVETETTKKDDMVGREKEVRYQRLCFSLFLYIIFF